MIETVSWQVDRYQAQDKFGKALAAQKSLVPLLTDLHETYHHLVTDANLRLTDLEFFSKLKPAELVRLKEATRLRDNGIERFQGKQFNECLEYHQQAYEIRREILGENHQIIARMCFEFGPI